MRRFILACSMWLLAGAAVAADSLEAIAPNTLTLALAEFASRSGLQVVYRTEFAQSLQSQGAEAGLSVEGALQQLLRDTGLRYEFINERTVAIRRRESTVDAEGKPVADTAGGGRSLRLARAQSVEDPTTARTVSRSRMRLAQASGNASSAETDETQLQEVTVFGHGNADNVRDIPQTVTTFGQELLLANTTGVTIDNVVRFVPTASALVSEYGLGSFATFRGFEATTIWNGMSLRNGYQSGSLSNVERVEVLMGPASILYGSMEPGGVINLVTKQPKKEFHLMATTEFGTLDAFGTAVDVGGPLSDRVGVRLNISYDGIGAEFDHYRRERTSIAPVLSFDVTADTRLILEGHYLRSDWPKGFWENTRPVIGTLQPNPGLGPIPESTNLGYIEGITEATYDWYDLSARVSHGISDTLSANAALAYRRNRRPQGLAIFAGFDYEGDDRSVARFPFDVRRGDNDYTAHFDLKGSLRTGGVGHEYMIGLDYRRYDLIQDFFDASLSLPNIDAYDPDYSGVDLGSPIKTHSQENSRTKAVFVQDRLHIGDRLTLLGGLRYSEFSSFALEEGLAPMDLDDSAVSSQIGVVYRATDKVAFFASRNEAFVPRFEVNDLTGEIYEPEESLQYEAGAKFDIGSTGLAGNVTYFFIKKPNVLAIAPEDPTNVIPVGAVEAKGFELSLQGKLASGLSLYAGYGYNRTEVTRATTFSVEGTEFGNAPRHTFSLISNYEIGSGALRGVTLNGALQYMGARWADAANTLELPAYTRIDLSVAYPVTEKFTVSLHGNHLTNETIYSNAFSTQYTYVGVGRTFMARMRYEY